ncbi:MAG: hypothetical protein AMXMBFR12_02910 [Candidatus Babeliales bacterium]
MNFFKSMALGLIFLSSLANAKVSLEAALVDDGFLTVIPGMILEMNQPSVQFVDEIRFEATLTEANTVVFDIAFKDENENYVSILQPELTLNPEETKAVLELATKNGNQLVLVVQVNEIKE